MADAEGALEAAAAAVLGVGGRLAAILATRRGLTRAALLDCARALEEARTILETMANPNRDKDPR